MIAVLLSGHNALNRQLISAQSSCRISDTVKWINDVAVFLRRYEPFTQRTARVS